MAFGKKNMAMVAVGAVAGGASGYVAGTLIDKTEYASKDPDAAYRAKMAGAGVSLAAGLGSLLLKKPVIGTVLAVVGAGMGVEAYTAHEAYKKATAPASATLNLGGGSPPIILQAPQVGGLPVQVSPAGVAPAPGALPVETVKILPPPQSPPIFTSDGLRDPGQSAGALRLQSGAAMRLGMGRGQAGAAMRLGMAQSGAAVRLGM